MEDNKDTLKTVKPTSSRRLPDEFDLPHAVAFYFHDHLARLAADLQRTGSLYVPISLEEGEVEKISSLEGEGLFAWLLETGREDVVRDISYRQLTAALTADAAHFLCESLLASGKGKLTVAFSLLRKPLKENLLLLEWLCGAPEDFLDQFHGESPWGYTPNRLSKEKRMEIMRAAVEESGSPGIDEEMLWLVRYSKRHPNSLETLWTKATHLVTSVEASATEPTNINFVFSTASAIEEQWAHYYWIVPLLMHHFLCVVESVAGRFIEWDEELRSTMILFRNLAFMRYAEEASMSNEIGVGVRKLREELGAIEFACDSCGSSVPLDSGHVDRFWLAGEVECAECGHLHNLWPNSEEARDAPR